MVALREAVETMTFRKVVERVQHFHVCLLEKPGNPILREHGRRVVIPLYAFNIDARLGQEP